MAARTTTKKRAFKLKPEAKAELQAVLDKAATRIAKDEAQAKAKAKKPSPFEAKVGDKTKLTAAVKAADAARKALTERDRAIKAAVKSGTSARQVALAVGLTHPAVLKIVKR
jgi:DNA-binding NarL/FixJ family response regulator